MYLTLYHPSFICFDHCEEHYYWNNTLKNKEEETNWMDSEIASKSIDFCPKKIERIVPAPNMFYKFLAKLSVTYITGQNYTLSSKYHRWWHRALRVP